MPAKRNVEPRSKTVEPLEKIANLFALLVMKESKQGDAIVQLGRAGFSDDEIANLLNVTGGVIRQTRYLANKKKSK